MNIKLFVNALTLDEKQELLNELTKRFSEGETLKDFVNRILSHGPAISARLYNVLKEGIKYDDYANCPIGKILENNDGPCLYRLRGFGNRCHKEFKELRGY